MKGFFSHSDFFQAESESNWSFGLLSTAKKRFRQMRQKTSDRNIEISVTLNELYTGATKILKYKRNVICKECRGKGSSDGSSPLICDKCGGRGRLLELIKSRNNVQILQNICPKCHGCGELVTDLCKLCNGTGVNHIMDTINVEIEKGMSSNDVLLYKNKSDEEPGAETGSLHITLKEQPHKYFERYGDNLKYTKRISISSAISSTSFAITHLDGHKIICQTSTPVKPGDFRKVLGQGMPLYDDPFIYGDLYVYFEIIFPIYNDLPHEITDLIRHNIKEEPEGEICVGRPCNIDEFYEDSVETKDNANSSQATDCAIA